MLEYSHIEGGEPQFDPDTLPHYISRIDESTRACEEITLSFYNNPDKHADDLSVYFSALALDINESVRFIMGSDEYSDSEKIGMVASLLKEDDSRRSSFLNGVVQSKHGEQLKSGYLETEKIQEGLFELLNQIKEDEEDVGSFVQIVMQKHVEFINADISYLVNSIDIVEKIKKAERSKQLINEAKKFGMLVLAATLGGIIASKLP